MRCYAAILVVSLAARIGVVGALLRVPAWLQHPEPAGKNAYGLQLWNLEPGFRFPNMTAATEEGENIKQATRHDPAASRCRSYALGVREPMTSEYFVDASPARVEDFPGGVPKAIFSWAGNISRDSLEDLARQYGDSDVLYMYKVHNRRLFRQVRPGRASSTTAQQSSERLLLLALHVHHVPDLHFALHLGDKLKPGKPAITASGIDLSPGSGGSSGFSAPTRFRFDQALGPVQQTRFLKCLLHHYPLASRVPKLFFRGSTTDATYRPCTQANALNLTRVRAHLQSTKHPDLLDVGVTRVVQAEPSCEQAIKRRLALARGVPVEAWNRFALLLSLDGNAYSGRLQAALGMPTPIVKQASPYHEWFSHLVHTKMEHVDAGLQGLVGTARRLVEEWVSDPRRLTSLAEEAYGVMQYLGQPLALIEAMAYALTKWSERQAWATTVEEGDGFELVDPGTLFSGRGQLQNMPPAFVDSFYTDVFKRQKPGARASL